MDPTKKKHEGSQVPLLEGARTLYGIREFATCDGFRISQARRALWRSRIGSLGSWLAILLLHWLANSSWLARRTGRTDGRTGRTGRTDRTEGLDGRTGRTDGQDGQDGRTDRTDGGTGRTDRTDGRTDGQDGQDGRTDGQDMTGRTDRTDG